MLSTEIIAVINAVAGIATALAVAVAAGQIHTAKKQGVAAFEEALDEQYRAISLALPVDVLIGKMPKDHDKDKVRELIFNYLDLCNNEVYYRAKGRISSHTWMSWNTGMKSLLSMPAFQEVYVEVIEKTGFTYLARLVEDNFKTDPIKWYR